ncbi:type II toxin-antitoxin system VapC family toxin [Salmonella enterica subsp. enterica]|nr:type II toxin-antitoxin system VapC family toxin [Salmonella enterica subsp. enterica]MIL09247.1 type II toxin-antitoxin system VapC family toxin [Salmonella enterica subsp. enterica serovar Enteritidis]
MFVDTSVFVAILSGEDDADQWTAALDAGGPLITSTLVMLEAVMRLSTKLRVTPEEAERAVRAMASAANIQVEPIGEPELSLAVGAFSRYGKGRGHPAQLNLADCLSYACAKARGVQLLYKGEDFAQTDLAS